MTLGRVAELLALPGLALFAQPRLLAELDQVKASGLSGCVLDETECPMRPACSATATLPEIRLVAASGECECAHDVRRDAAGGWSADAPRSGPSSGGPRHYAISDDRLLLRIQAPESAVPSVNSALQLDALRVLESSTAGGIDWLVSLDEEEEEEVVERLECGAGRGLSPRGAPLRPAHLAGSRWAWHGARAAGGLPRRRLHAGRPPARDRGAVEGGARCPLRHAARALYRSSTLLGDGWACRRRVPRRSLPPTRRGMGGALAREPAADAVRTGEPARGGLWRRRREVGARRSSTFVSALPKRFLASILPVAGVR